MTPPEPESAETLIRETAARWVVRRDRGLSATESVEFELWLADDPRHAAAMRSYLQAWSQLDRLPDGIAAETLQAAMRQRRFWRRTIVATSLAAVATIALVAVSRQNSPAVSQPLPVAASESAGAPHCVTLSDGSFVQLNTASEIVEQFTATERRVVLTRGEAHFSVTKNPARPFVVRVGGVEVRAVGTAFNVNLQSTAVEVLVTEGVVELNASADAPPTVQTAAVPLLNAGQRAVIPLVPESRGVAPMVTTVNAEEISRQLAWQEPLLRLGGSTLAEVATNFERRNGRRVIFADPELANLRLGGRFRADDLDGFVSLLATTLDVDVERAADGTLVIRKKNQIRDSGK